MKGFGPLGHGGPFSSSSNLSPLAPPFTVDQSFPRPIHPPETYFNDEPNYTFSARPLHENWLNAPTFVPNAFPNPSPTLSPGTHSISPAGIAPASSYGHSMTNLFSPQPVTRPYHPHYPSASIQDSTGSTPMTANEHGNMLPALGFPPTAPSDGFWNGKSSGEQWKGNGANLSALPSYASLVNQGISATAGLPAYEEPSDVWFGKSVDSFAGKSYVGSHCTNFQAGKPSLASDENFRDAPFDMSKNSGLNVASLQETPCYRAPSPEERWTQLNPSTTAYGSYFTGFDSYKTDPLCFYPASSNSSVDPIYVSPSIKVNSTTHKNRAMSANPTPIERPRDACDRKEASASYSPPHSGCIQVSAESNELFGDTSSSMDGVHEIDPSRLKDFVPLQSTPVISIDPLKNLFRSKNKVQVSDFDLPCTLGTSKTGAGDSFDSSSEEVEQFNPGIDSPCWKGAVDSRYSLFGEAEAGTSFVPSKVSEGCNGFNLQGLHKHPDNSPKYGTYSFPEIHKNFTWYEEDSSSTSLKQPSPVVKLPCEDNGLNENVIHCSVTSNNGDSDLQPSQAVKFSYYGSDASARQQLICEDKIADSGTDVKDAAHVGTSRPSYDVNNYSSLPSSRGNIPVPINLTEPLLGPSSATSSECQLQTVLKSMHNLSESLLSFSSKDEEAFKEQDHVVIQQILQNLDTCLSRVGAMRSSPKMHVLQSETPNSPGKQSNLHKKLAGGVSQATNTEVKDVQSSRCIQNACEGKKNSSLFGMTEDNSPPGDPEFEHDDMTKGIKRILEENFEDEEEANLQSLLYKNLWLEAEAALCSIKYKARFSRMKIEMEKYKQQCARGGEPTEHKNDNSVEGEVSSVSTEDDLNKSSTSSGAEEDVEASVMARFRVLTSRISNGPYAEDDVDASVMDRFRILTSRVNNIIPNASTPGPTQLVDHFGIETGPGVDSPGQGDVLVEFGAKQSSKTRLLMDRVSAGEGDSPSSDWEHVLKEATWPA